MSPAEKQRPQDYFCSPPDVGIFAIENIQRSYYPSIAEHLR